MNLVSYIIRKIIYGIPLIVGVTLISFTLMVYFGPDKTYELIGKNPTAEQIAEVRHQLGYDRPFAERYVSYLVELFTLDLGNSDSSGQLVSEILKETIPISIALSVPFVVLGTGASILLALLAAMFRGSWVDRAIMSLAVIGMSVSVVMVIIAFQVIFCSSYGLDLFPVQGWDIYGPVDYLKYVTVPTLATIFVAIGYDTRFFRAVFVEEMGRDYVRTARAYGIAPRKILAKYVIKNCMIPIITRVVFTFPLIILGGSLLIEAYFGIPGIGLASYRAITSGDQPVLKAIVGLTAIVYVFMLTFTDILYRVFDPRVSLQ